MVAQSESGLLHGASGPVWTSATLDDPLIIALVFGGGLMFVLGGLTIMYDIPRGTSWIDERRRVVVHHQMRAGTAVGARRIWPAMLPLGILVLLVGLASVLSGWSAPWPVLGLIAGVGAVVAFIVTAVMIIRPPARLLPEWYRVEEQRRRQGLGPAMPPPRGGAVPTMTRRQRWLAVAAMISIAVIAFVLRWPLVPVLAGLSAGLVVLSATRTRD